MRCVYCEKLQKNCKKLQKCGANVVQNLVISKKSSNFAARNQKTTNMENNEILQRLLVLAEKQDQHICELEKLVKAQQRTIDTLTAMAQPIIKIENQKIVNVDAHQEQHAGGTAAAGNITVNCDASSNNRVVKGEGTYNEGAK